MSRSKSSRILPAIVGLAVLVSAAAQKGGEGKHLELATPLAAVTNKARGAATPLWQIPLGTCYVDMMVPLEGGRLLVGLKSISRGIPNRECLAVDRSDGSIVWRMERRPQGDYDLLFDEEGLLVFRINEPKGSFLLAVEAATGRERWSVRPGGGTVRVAALPSGADILLQSQKKNRFETVAIRFSDGATVWRRGWDLAAPVSECPAPLVDAEGILLFPGGVSRIDPQNGEPIWSRTDISPDPDGAPPQFGGPGLLVAAGEMLFGVDLKSGDTVWKAPLSNAPSNIFPVGDAVYVRGDLPYQDPAGRFKIQVPPAWPLVSRSEGEEVYRFQDPQTAAFILLACHRSASSLDEPFDLMLGIVNKSLAASAARRREMQDIAVGGRQARWARYDYPAKIEGSKEKPDVVSYVGAVFDAEKHAAIGFLSWSHAEDIDDVRPVLDRAFRSIRLGETESVADRWRQRGQASEPLIHEISELSASDGKRRWSAGLAETTVSNFIIQGDRLYVATPREVYALNSRTGAKIYSTVVAESGHAFPVRLDLYEGRLAFVGELVIASCDAKTGERLYSHGITPLSQETYIAGLDNTIPQFEDAVAELKGVKIQSGPAAEWAAKANRDIKHYQNLSNHYTKIARSSFGSYESRVLAASQSDSARQQEKSAATAALVYTMMDVGWKVGKAKILQKWVRQYEDILARQQLFRRSIFSAYHSADLGDYVFRPDLQIGSQDDASFAAITIVHLPTGRRRTLAVSPSYLEYGLWNWIDVEKGIVYHHGLGLDPSRYEYGEIENVGAYGKVRALKSFLIAVPLKMP